MSFILDALRRAEAERARGAVPGLHTPESALPTEARGDDRRAPKLLLGLGVAAALVLTGGLAWWLGSRGPANNPTVPSAAAPSLPPPVAVVVQPEPPAAAPPAMPPPAQPTAMAAPAPLPLPVPVSPPTTTPAPVPQRPRPAVAQRPMPDVAQATPAVQAAPQAVPQPAAQAVTARLPTLAELPEPLRMQVPPLVVAGGMYAEVPSQRLAILNGQVVHEGDQPAPGLKVEQIRRRSVVFSLNGQRFEVPM